MPTRRTEMGFLTGEARGLALPAAHDISASAVRARLAAPRRGGIVRLSADRLRQLSRDAGGAADVAGVPFEQQTVSEILDDYSAATPVDVFSLAKALRLQVIQDKNLAGGVAGKIEKHGTHYRIIVNGNDVEVRQRFTVAHEIAHYLLHRDKIGAGIVDSVLYRSTLRDDLEAEANERAAQILMPAEAVKTFWRTGVRAFAEMAQIFHVSMDAARFRMQSLRLF